MRRLKRKGYLLFFLSLLLLSTLCGCGGNTASSAASKEKTDSGEGITTEAAEDKNTWRKFKDDQLWTVFT